jgi:hypothetical protein
MNRKGMARYLRATGVLLAPHITASITLAVIVGALLADATHDRHPQPPRSRAVESAI